MPPSSSSSPKKTTSSVAPNTPVRPRAPPASSNRSTATLTSKAPAPATSPATPALASSTVPATPTKKVAVRRPPATSQSSSAPPATVASADRAVPTTPSHKAVTRLLPATSASTSPAKRVASPVDASSTTFSSRQTLPTAKNLLPPAQKKPTVKPVSNIPVIPTRPTKALPKSVVHTPSTIPDVPVSTGTASSVPAIAGSLSVSTHASSQASKAITNPAVPSVANQTMAETQETVSRDTSPRKRKLATTKLQAGADASDSEPDQGAHIDRSDSAYRGPSTKNRVQASSSIIRTRSAIAAAQSNSVEDASSSPNRPPPSSPPPTPSPAPRKRVANPTLKKTPTASPVRVEGKKVTPTKRRKTERVVLSPPPEVAEGPLPEDMDLDHPVASDHAIHDQPSTPTEWPDSPEVPIEMAVDESDLRADPSVHDDFEEEEELEGVGEVGEGGGHDEQTGAEEGDLEDEAEIEEEDYEDVDLDQYEESFIDDSADFDDDGSVGSVDNVDCSEELEYVDEDVGDVVDNDEELQDAGSDPEDVAQSVEMIDANDVEDGGTEVPPLKRPILRRPPSTPTPPPFVPPETPKKKKAKSVPVINDSSDDDISFADAVGVVPEAPVAGNNVFKQKVEWIAVRGVEPDGNVMIEALQDRMLKKYYTDDLEPLRAGVLKSWSSTEARVGMVMFEDWATTCPSMKIKSCLSAINFVKSGNYINLARCALTDVCIRNIGVSNQNYHLYTANRQPAICLSAAMCNESFLECVPPKGLRKHGLGCTLHTQEYERNVGFLASAHGCDGFHSQMYQNTIRFETMSNFKQEKDDAPSSSSQMSLIRSPGVALSSKAKSAPTQEDFVLPFDAKIPVYDCRAIRVNFNTDLDKLSSYPLWNGEVPEGSFVVVAYTVGVFWSTSNKGWAIGFNIRWAMILGVRPVYDV